MTLRRGTIVLILFSFWILAVALSMVHFAPGNWEVIKQKLAGTPPNLQILLGAFLALAALIFGGLLFSISLFRWWSRGFIRLSSS